MLDIMKESAAIRNPLKPGKNHEVFKNVCKGLSPELFEPAWSLAYPDLAESFNPKLINFPRKNLTAKASTAKACVRNKNNQRGNKH